MVKTFLTGAGVILIALAISLSAAAQSSQIKPFPITGKNKKNVAISVSYQFFIEGETRSMGDQAELADQGRRHLYKLLAKECEVLLETIATGCAMKRANVNTQLRNTGRSSQKGIRVSGSATYQIDLKPNAVKDD
ncbi:MAG: hypothetical protein ACR2PA_22185 [Hyphomicrobiaceae bacterium]